MFGYNDPSFPVAIGAVVAGYQPAYVAVVADYQSAYVAVVAECQSAYVVVVADYQSVYVAYLGRRPVVVYYGDRCFAQWRDEVNYLPLTSS